MADAAVLACGHRQSQPLILAPNIRQGQREAQHEQQRKEQRKDHGKAVLQEELGVLQLAMKRLYFRVIGLIGLIRLPNLYGGKIRSHTQPVHLECGLIVPQIQGLFLIGVSPGAYVFYYPLLVIAFSGSHQPALLYISFL